MAKRVRKNKKVRIVAIGAALATGGIVVALLPSANAAEEKTPDEIMNMCDRARVINGKQQTPRGFSGFLADRCTFIETNFEIFSGKTETITPTFPNCEPNATGPVKANSTFVVGVGQGKGKYTVTQQGGGGGLFDVLNLSWVKHKATLDLSLSSVNFTESEGRDVPIGKKLHMDFAPKMHRMTGKWRVEIDFLDQGNIAPDIEAQTYEAAEVVEGPVILAGAAGSEGGADGISTPVFTNC
jgi:hypothetical protein